MNLDIRVKRPPGRRAPGPNDRPASERSSVPPPVDVRPSPPSSPDPLPLPAQRPSKPSGKGKWVWRILLIILFIALLVLVYVIWGESREEEEIFDDISPVVSTFTPPEQPVPLPPEQPEEEEILSLSLLGSKLNDLNEEFSEIIDANNEQATSSDRVETWRSLVGDYMVLHEKYLQYYNDLESKVFIGEDDEILLSYLEDVSSKLDQAKIELDIATFALGGDEEQEVAVDSMAEAITSLQNASNSLSAATNSMSLLEQEMTFQDDLLNLGDTTTTSTSTIETATSTDLVTTTTATTTVTE